MHYVFSYAVIQDDMYLRVGRIIALSILHGGPGPTFFAPIVVDYLFGGFSAVKPCIEDVPDNELQLKINKVHNQTCFSHRNAVSNSVTKLK